MASDDVFELVPVDFPPFLGPLFENRDNIDQQENERGRQSNGFFVFNFISEEKFLKIFKWT